MAASGSLPPPLLLFFLPSARGGATATTSTMMRVEIGSLASNPTPIARFSADGRHPAASFGCRLKKRRPSPGTTARSIRASSSSDRSRPSARTLVCPEPPWLVVPPSPPENPFSGQAWPTDLHIKGAGGTEVPLSIRMVQRKKRMAGAGPGWMDAPPREAEGGGHAVEGHMGKAVSAVVFMIGELQRSVMAGGDGAAVDESVLDRAARERRDSFVWLLRRVFFSSPDLMAELLLLLAEYVTSSAEQNGCTAGAFASSEAKSEANGRSVGSTLENIRIGDYQNWFDIGIEEGSLETGQHESEETCVDRRRRAYERTIAEGGANSLILCNYAQFLYRIAHDHERAEKYFQWAVMAEPRDAEAMSGYAFFLWEERGDLSLAEEMFLEAIEAEPGNHHYSSNYAWFLWKTGAADTCYPLDHPAAEDVD